jgi:transketolase
MALGSRLSGRNFRVFNFLSDGEIQEGATWEAAMAASHYALGNLYAIVDVNNMQADGPPPNVMTIEPLVDKFRAFGWHAQRVDGNSIEQLLQAFDTASGVTGRPKVLVCDTLMGKGVPFIERRPKAHFVRIEPQEWEQAVREFEEAGI